MTYAQLLEDATSAEVHKKWRTAIDHLNEASRLKPSAEPFDKRIIYNRGLWQFAGRHYSGAVKSFQDVLDYKDAAALLAKAKHLLEERRKQIWKYVFWTIVVVFLVATSFASFRFCDSLYEAGRDKLRREDWNGAIQAFQSLGVVGFRHRLIAAALSMA